MQRDRSRETPLAGSKKVLRVPSQSPPLSINQEEKGEVKITNLNYISPSQIMKKMSIGLIEKEIDLDGVQIPQYNFSNVIRENEEEDHCMSTYS